MFQRLKGAIDSRIAEEQARQKATAPTSDPKSASTTRRSHSRTDSPSTRTRRARSKEDGVPARSPDPSEFEAAFVIEDESEAPSRVGTPVIAADKEATMSESSKAGEGETSGDGNGKRSGTAAEVTPMASELPIEVRTKLRKLDKLESRYQDLLKSYRIAHGRVKSIEPFEKALKEHTPLATISDPNALIEYLNQLNLKGDMVMDELKRVTTDRDNYKKKAEEAERKASAAQAELASMKDVSEGAESAPAKTETSSIEGSGTSVKSPVSSVLGGLFSPKQKAQPSAGNRDVSEEFFSYDDEIPQLQTDIREKTAEIEALKLQVSELERSLASAQESSFGLVENLERVNRELSDSKEAVAEGQAYRGQITVQAEEIQTLKAKLGATEKQITILETDLANQRKEAEKNVSSLKNETKTLKETSSKDLQAQTDARNKAVTALEKLEIQFKELEESKANDNRRIQELSKEAAVLKEKVEEAENHEVPASSAKIGADSETPAAAPPTGGAAKKKNKKKKKGGNAALASKEDISDTTVTAAPIPLSPSVDLQGEISRLKEEIADRDAQIAKLQTKRKTEEDLREDLENMQDNFLAISQEHVEAKDKIKELLAEKKTFEEKIHNLEKELEEHKSSAKGSEKAEADLKSLTVEYEDLKSKSATLQTDLGAAQQLATSRYRDLTELREVLQKAQPELKSLRTENANLKTAKDDLATRTSELRRLEARERDLKSDVAAFKKQAADRDSEVKALNEKISQESNGRLKAEDQARIAGRDLRKSEAEKIQLAASGEKSAAELQRVQEELSRLRPRLNQLEDQVAKLTNESKSLRDEVELRGSQYNNAQGLLGSMRDQAGEMAMQLKEAKEQSESLEEELSEVQRLLSERTREGETMRRLLADVDDRADAKVREMRERMEAAIEERDRAEDEASTNGRRRAREVDELKQKIRDFERDLKRATDDRDELVRSEKEWKRRRDELESSSENASKEVNEIRAAMGELRSALDGSEKQVRDAEKQRSDLRRILDEANQRYEKLQKEFKMLQAKQNKLGETSSRSSIDSGRVGTPPTNGTVAPGKMDYVYLKTILLQFLEQKDKKRQADLVKTVLGQLLHFDKKDQEKWIAAISAK